MGNSGSHQEFDQLAQMGNSVSHKEYEQLAPMFDKISDIACPELDIGDSCGSTGYIDQINQLEIHGSMMKGIDIYGRRFIVWKAMVTIENPNRPDIVYPTFTTFFKRYPDTTSIVYHTCGHDGRNLFNTEGGTVLQQMEFLHKLLLTGSAELNFDQANALRISYPFHRDEDNNKHGWIFKIKLVDSLDCSKIEPI